MEVKSIDRCYNELWALDVSIRAMINWSEDERRELRQRLVSLRHATIRLTWRPERSLFRLQERGGLAGGLTFVYIDHEQRDLFEEPFEENVSLNQTPHS